MVHVTDDVYAPKWNLRFPELAKDGVDYCHHLSTDSPSFINEENINSQEHVQRCLPVFNSLHCQFSHPVRMGRVPLHQQGKKLVPVQTTNIGCASTHQSSRHTVQPLQEAIQEPVLAAVRLSTARGALNHTIFGVCVGWSATSHGHVLVYAIFESQNSQSRLKRTSNIIPSICSFTANERR